MAAIKPIASPFTNAELSKMFRVVQSSETEKVIFDGVECEVTWERLQTESYVEDRLNAYDNAITLEENNRRRDTIRDVITTQKAGSDRVADLACFYQSQVEGQEQSAFLITDDQIADFVSSFATGDEDDCEND